MRMKIISILLGVVFIATVSFFVINLRNSASAKTPEATEPISESSTSSELVTTDNQTNPDQIPDRLAYKLLLDFYRIH